MNDKRPLGSLMPFGTLDKRDDVDESVIAQYEEQRVGEVDLDQIVWAQSSAPQVVKRMIELENCIWSLASELLKLDKRIRTAIGADRTIELAKWLLKNRLELDEAGRPILSGDLLKRADELGPISKG